MAAPKVKTARKVLGRKRSGYMLATQFPGMPGRCPADDVIAHLQELAGFGLPMRSVARATGFHEATIRDIARGERWATILTRHRAILLAVTHRPTPEQEWVLPIGATRRLRALAVIGWTVPTLAGHTPLPTGVLAELMSARRVSISYETWAAVVALFELLSGTPGPSKLARSRAMAKGWGAPLDWEDLDIDDPRVTAVPSGPPKVTERTRAADRRERARELLESGLSVETAAARLGVTVRQVERYIREIKSENAA